MTSLYVGPMFCALLTDITTDHCDLCVVDVHRLGKTLIIRK